MSKSLELFEKDLADQRLKAKQNHEAEMAEIQRNLKEKRAKLDLLAERIKKEKTRHEEAIRKLRKEQDLEKENRKKEHEVEIGEHFAKIAGCVQNYSSLEDEQKSLNQRVLTANVEEKKNHKRNSKILEVKYRSEMVKDSVTRVIESIAEEDSKKLINASVKEALEKISELNKLIISSSEIAEIQPLANHFESLNASELDSDEIDKDLGKFEKLCQNILKANTSSSKTVLQVIAEKPKAALKN